MEETEPNSNGTETLEQYVRETSESCALRFGRVGWSGLDFSRDSLTIADEILGEASDFVKELPKEIVTGLAEAFGCYLMEVARREFGGNYYWHADRAQPVLVVGEPNFRVAVMGFDKVEGRLQNGHEDNLPFFYAGFAGRIESAQDGDNILFV